MILFWIAVAGGLGAVGRFVADGFIRTALGRTFPWATLIINVVGSFILGVLTSLALYHHINLDSKLILGTGFCGGFTTFSTASFETARLLEEKRYLAAVMQAVGNLCLTMMFAGIGFILGR